jgi:hypothetical protein
MSQSIIEILQTTNLVFIRSHPVVEEYIVALLSMFGTSGGPWIVKRALLIACASILESDDCIIGKPEVITSIPIISALLIYAFTQRDYSESSIDQERVKSSLVELIDVNFGCFEEVVLEKSYGAEIDGLMGLVDDLLKVEALFGVAIALLKQLQVYFVGEARIGAKYKSLAGRAKCIDWYVVPVYLR